MAGFVNANFCVLHKNKKMIFVFVDKKAKIAADRRQRDLHIPAEAITHLAEMGLMGIPYPKEYGGAGLDVMS